jgi:hypothetical protein
VTTPPLELADVLRAYGPAYLEAYGDTLSVAQRRALRDLVRCRTAELGGHVEACDQCGHRRIAYNSCRNRHCPKCQVATRARWLDERAAELLPVEYFHVVFTLPDEIGPLALQNPRAVYGSLFRASAATMLRVAADPARLGADIGFVSVLHTWGQNLHLHPHVHCVVPGGGLAGGGDRWVACRPGFFLPVRVLSRVFRSKFLAALEQDFKQGRLAFYGRQQPLADPAAFFDLTQTLRRREWVVYAKPPFAGPEQVLKYLARYTHRVAISNSRLVKVEGGHVHFTWRDYADGHVQKVMALPALEFIRRFLQHVVPSGFVRIRHYGLLANRHREEKLQRCRALLHGEPPASGTTTAPACVPEGPEPSVAAPSWQSCPSCGRGRMVWVDAVPRLRPSAQPMHGRDRALEEPVWDTS